MAQNRPLPFPSCFLVLKLWPLTPYNLILDLGLTRLVNLLCLIWVFLYHCIYYLILLILLLFIAILAL